MKNLNNDEKYLILEALQDFYENISNFDCNDKKTQEIENLILKLEKIDKD